MNLCFQRDEVSPVGNAAEQPEQGAERGQWVWRQRWQEPRTPRAGPATPVPLWLPARGRRSVRGAWRTPPAPGRAESSQSHID